MKEEEINKIIKALKEATDFVESLDGYGCMNRIGNILGEELKEKILPKRHWDFYKENEEF